MSDIRAAKDNITILPDSIYTFDKGYYDLNWFQAISDVKAFFVTRIKTNAQIEFLGQHREPNKKLGGLRDEIIWYTGYQSVKKYPGELRLIEFLMRKTKRIISLLPTISILQPLQSQKYTSTGGRLNYFSNGSSRI